MAFIVSVSLRNSTICFSHKGSHRAGWLRCLLVVYNVAAHKCTTKARLRDESFRFVANLVDVIAGTRNQTRNEFIFDVN